MAEEINLGFRYLNPQVPDQASFAKELAALRADIQAIAQVETVAQRGNQALIQVDSAISEVQQEEPKLEMLRLWLRGVMAVLTEIGDTLEAAEKVGPLVMKALTVATGLYTMAQHIF